MKKETVSVLKPRNGKQFNGKAKKLIKGKPGKIEKKTSPKKDSLIEPRGAKKSKIVGIENVLGINLKSLKSIESRLGNQDKITSVSPENVNKDKKKNVKNDATTNDKMAAVPKHPQVETRGSPKKPKIHAADKLAVASVKSGKKGNSNIEHANVNKVNSEITMKKEKKQKSKLKTVEEPKAKSEAVPKKEKKLKSKLEIVEKSEVKPEVASKKGKKRKSKLETTDELEKIEPEVTRKSKRKKKLKIETADGIKNDEPEVAKLSKKSIESVKKTKIEDSGDLKLTKTHILKSVETIMKLSAKELNSKKTLLPTDNDPVFLQVICVKIPKTPRRQIRPYLPHPLAGPLDDIAIFVPDLELGRRKDYEKTVDHWETIFREKGIDCVKEIIPMNRVKTEYGQFEMRRKLAQSFDYFLADGRICGHLTHLLGRGFYNRRSAPTPVKLSRDNLKEEFDYALHKTCMEIHGFGDSHSVQVGHVSMEATKLVDNVWATCEALAEQYPGGWENIRAIRIKTRTSLAIPIYMTLKSKNKIAAPVVKPKRPRAYETVEGELTTLPGLATVTVTPEGKVKLKRERDFDGEDENDVKEEDDDEDDDDEVKEEDDDDNDEMKEEDDEDEQ